VKNTKIKTHQPSPTTAHSDSSLSVVSVCFAIGALIASLLAKTSLMTERLHSVVVGSCEFKQFDLSVENSQDYRQVSSFGGLPSS